MCNRQKTLPFSIIVPSDHRSTFWAKFFSFDWIRSGKKESKRNAEQAKVPVNHPLIETNGCLISHTTRLEPNVFSSRKHSEHSVLVHQSSKVKKNCRKFIELNSFDRNCKLSPWLRGANSPFPALRWPSAVLCTIFRWGQSRKKYGYKQEWTAGLMCRRTPRFNRKLFFDIFFNYFRWICLNSSEFHSIFFIFITFVLISVCFFQILSIS